MSVTTVDSLEITPRGIYIIYLTLMFIFWQMINGKFVENEVFALLESMAGSNLEEFKKNMLVVDDCGNTTG